MNRTETGHFKKGRSGNPAGRKPIYQDFNARALFILEKYTVGDMTEIMEAMHDKKHPRYKQARLITMRDAVILTSWCKTITLEGAIPAGEMLDRILGKPAQAVTIDQTIAEQRDYRKQEDEETEEMLVLLAQRRAAMKCKTPDLI